MTTFLAPAATTRTESPAGGKGGAQRYRLFDLLRILFALAVLLSHAPEMTDGDPHRELLFRLTHSMTFGEFGVDGFFLLSGFLIVKSWLSDPELGNFLRKRCLRILPGYFVAVVLSVLAVGLLAPGVPHWFQGLNKSFLVSVAILSSPATPPVLPGLTYRLVNGSLWTIPFEFRCYLLVALAGTAQVFRQRWIWLTLTILCLSCATFPWLQSHLPHVVYTRTMYALLGNPAQTLGLTSIFMVGGCFALFQRYIPFTVSIAGLAALVLVGFVLWLPPYVPVAFVLCGGYLMFYFGQSEAVDTNWMRHLPDISYGIYLYGWPVECLWIWYMHGSPWVTFLVSALICFILGALSWHLVERPMLAFKRRALAPAP